MFEPFGLLPDVNRNTFIDPPGVATSEVFAGAIKGNVALDEDPFLFVVTVAPVVSPIMRAWTEVVAGIVVLFTVIKPVPTVLLTLKK
jgi:hypothetical protein